jgi:hypothetical protein
MSAIFNLTQHNSTPTQAEVGVVDPSADVHRQIKKLLDVPEVPTSEDLHERAEGLALMVPAGTVKALIGGAGPLMRLLRRELKTRGVEPLEAFSRRVVVETTTPDGRVVKTSDFVHAGWWPDVD